jgi:hypothetical protein
MNQCPVTIKVKNKLPKYVYRIEHKETREGPYNRLSFRHSDYEEHPAPFEETNEFKKNWDRIRPEREYYYFGFISIKQLNAWFLENDRTLLHKHGFVIGIYKTSEYFNSDKQAVFNKLLAKHIMDRKLF